MPYDPQKHHRRSIRLPDFDYAQEGAYFITICTHNRECLFGEVDNALAKLNDYGQLVGDEWQRLPTFHTNLDIDAFVVMPNHMHGIIILRGHSDQRHSIGEIIRRFKRYSTKAVNQQRNAAGEAVWQRNYFERVIRNEAMLNAIREYIMQNPANWAEDTENPDKMRSF